MLARSSSVMDASGGMKNTKQAEEEEEEGRRALKEPVTLQWPADGAPGKGDRTSVMSDLAASWTESERELKVGAEPMVGAGLDTYLEVEAEPEENLLPEKAAQVFSPASLPSSPTRPEAFWDMESEKRPFLGPQVPPDYNHNEWLEDTPPSRCGRGCPGRDVLKVGVSVMTSALFFPLLVWGGYVFLPFDAPLLTGAPLRLVYTLRCSVFATIPIILGWLVLGVCRVRSGVVGPLCNYVQKGAELGDVGVTIRFLSDSASLFLIYFLQLVVMAMFLSQEQLKLVPLLTIIYTTGRLVYWVAAAFGSSIRGFGFGLSFLPSVVMMVANFYFVFTVEAGGSIFSVSHPREEALPPPGRQRFWG